MDATMTHDANDDTIQFSDVKIPISKRWPPEVTIRRTDVPFDNLPAEAQDAHLRFIGIPKEVQDKYDTLTWGTLDTDEYPKWDTSNKSTYQCTKCGYLTQSKALSPTAYQRYECGNDDCSNSTGKTTREGFRRVNSMVQTPDGDKEMADVESDDVPNHPTHLGRIKNLSASRLTGNEYRQKMYEALSGMTLSELLD